MPNQIFTRAHIATGTYCDKCIPNQRVTCAHTLQHTATHCNSLQLTATNACQTGKSHVHTHHNTPQHTATQYNTLQITHAKPDIHTCTHLQHTATHCNSLQLTATHCNSLQLIHAKPECHMCTHTATHRSTPQHTANKTC